MDKAATLIWPSIQHNSTYIFMTPHVLDKINTGQDLTAAYCKPALTVPHIVCVGTGAWFFREAWESFGGKLSSPAKLA